MSRYGKHVASNDEAGYSNRFTFIGHGLFGGVASRTPALAREVAAELTAWAADHDDVTITLPRANADALHIAIANAVRGLGWPMGAPRTGEVLVALAAALADSEADPEPTS